jgi:hypothetical protein
VSLKNTGTVNEALPLLIVHMSCLLTDSTVHTVGFTINERLIDIHRQEEEANPNASIYCS